MRFYVYDITSDKPELVNKFADCVEAAMKKATKVKDRMMELNPSESTDVDFIADKLNQDGFFCASFIRLKKGITSILKTSDLEKETIKIADIIEESNDSAGSIKDTQFFCIYKSTNTYKPLYQSFKSISLVASRKSRSENKF